MVEKRILKTALHLHSWVSTDCSLTKKQFIDLYQKTGFDCLAVTDHNEIAGAKELAKEGQFKIIIGEEIETKDGDLIGLFLKEKIEPHQSLEATIGQIKRQKGLVYLPHPFDRLRRNVISPKKIAEIIESVDLIEIFNARNLFAADDKKVERFLKETLGSNLPLPVCGTDAHTKYEIGKTYLEMPNFNDPDSFLVSIKNSRLIVNYSPKFVHLITKLKKWSNQFLGKKF